MSETNAQEPTMEEILASIRRIISEDDPPAEAAAAPSASAHAAPTPGAEAPAPPVKAEPPPAPEPIVAAHEEDVLELTDPVEPPPPPPVHHETVSDMDVFSQAPAPAAPGFTPSAPTFPAEPLTGSYASETSAGHFGALARSVAMPKDGRSLEDVVRELLKPLLRDWLDQHLPSIVEARVQAEVERIARRNEY